MLSVYDYIVIGIYISFTVGVGLVFRKINTSTSDYFRSGGKVLWWMVGATAFMTQFSAWTFTGAASKAYENGALILVVYFASVVAYLFNWAATAPRLRRMRNITMLESVRERWGRRNEQFFTWIQLPLGVLTAGIALTGLGVVMSTVFRLPMEVTIVGSGVIVVFVTTLGGSWAAVAGDFVQMLVLMAITTATAILSIQHLGGVNRFWEGLPEQSIVWGDVPSSGMLWMWIVAMLFKNSIIMNNISDGYRYLCAKDDKHARWGALLAAGLFLIGPIIWFVPPMAARILFPDLTVVEALQPLGSKISDGAYLAIGLKTMPQGMIGLMITALFASTLTSMDTGLNKNTGVFVRSFYSQIIRPAATDRELLYVSKLTTVVLGFLIVLCALMFNQLSHLSLFNLMQQFTSLIAMPIAMPLFLGMFFRSTPPWSGWSTVLICFLTSLVVGNIEFWFGHEAYNYLLFRDVPLLSHEVPDSVFILGVFANTLVGTIWFFLTSFWYRRQTPEFRQQVDDFFRRMATPINSQAEHVEKSDGMQFRMLGKLCVAYGVFIILLIFVPNSVGGRLYFCGIGCAIAAIGAWLMHLAACSTTRETKLKL